MSPVFFLKKNESDVRVLHGWTTFVYKGNPIMNEAWEAFKTMSDKEGVVVYMGKFPNDDPVKWVRVIQDADGYGYHLNK